MVFPGKQEMGESKDTMKSCRSKNCLLKGPIGIFWDIENCGVPSDVLPGDVAGNIRRALQVHSMVEGVATVFSAYGDLSSFSRQLRECFYRTGVKLVDVPNTRKEAADKAILVDMFLFALDNRPPSSIMLISGDIDFAPTLHILGQRGYSVILATPKGVCVSSELRNAGQIIWDWSCLARGEGLMTPSSVNESKEAQPNSRSECSGSNSSITCHSAETCQSAETVSCLTGSSASTQSAMAQVQAGGINELKCELVVLLKQSGGCLPLARIPQEYAKLFRRPLIVSEYGATKLINLLDNVSDIVTIRWKEGKGTVYLLQSGDVNHFKRNLVKLLELSGGCLTLSQIPEEYKKLFQRPLLVSEYGATKLTNLLEKVSDTVTIRGKDGKKAVYLLQQGNVNDLKDHLAKLLELSGGSLALSQLPDEYTKLFQRPLIFSEFGATKLTDLLEKVSDTVTIRGKGTVHLVQQGNMSVLKWQLVKLLQSSGGFLPLSRVSGEYAKLFQQPLIVSQYGATTKANLLEKLSDVVVIRGKGRERIVHLLLPSVYVPADDGQAEDPTCQSSSTEVESCLYEKLIKLLEL